jgi:hypothetical protein
VLFHEALLLLQFLAVLVVVLLHFFLADALENALHLLVRRRGGELGKRDHF